MRPRVDSVAKRRERVGFWYVRKKIPEVILDLMTYEGFINDKGEPYHIKTIYHDIELLKAQWLENSKQSPEIHRANVEAELDRVIELAYERDDVDKVLKALAQKRALLGLDADKRIELTGNPERPININHEFNISEQTAETVFSILEGVGAFQSSTAETETDEIFPPATDT